MEPGIPDSVVHVLAGFVAEHFPEGVLVLDAGGRLLANNRAALSLLGTDPLGALDGLLEGNSSVARFLDELRNGSRTSLHVAPETRVDVAYRLDGAFVDGQFVVVVRDVRHERQRDAEIDRVRRNEAASQLATRVVHDMNNILTPILCMSTLLLAALDRGSPTSTYAREIEESAQRAVELAKELREFLARKDLRGNREITRVASAGGKPDGHSTGANAISVDDRAGERSDDRSEA